MVVALAPRSWVAVVRRLQKGQEIFWRTKVVQGMRALVHGFGFGVGVTKTSGRDSLSTSFTILLMLVFR
jgi:hypothetical protein